jgi:hypothetical protein
MENDARVTFAQPGWAKMADAVPGIIGKTIAHVVVKRRPDRPIGQVFLVFADGTYYEFYSAGDDITGTSAIDTGGLEDVRRYGGERWIVLQASAPVRPDGGPPRVRDVRGRGNGATGVDT